jgi:hypothetical protein
MERRLRGYPFGFVKRKLPAVRNIATARIRDVVGRKGPSGETTRYPEEIGQHRTVLDDQIACRYRRFWPEMDWFPLPAFSHGMIRVNLRGRELHGIVPEDRYGEVCDEAERVVRECRNPRTGESVVGEILRPREKDPMDPENPEADLVLVWQGAPDAFVHPRAGRIGPYPYHRTGGHSTHGLAMVAGPEIEPADMGERSIMDVTPTILRLLGRPVPDDMEGIPLPVQAGTTS